VGFAQLYYTSCESGLSGFTGFQFNAVTPGLPPQILREVETLASYQPPRRVGSKPTAADIAACPVSLVYSAEPTTILARVVFVGTDFSGRSGNYFAHALVSEDGPDPFGEVLPIELWDSPLWAAEPIGVTELPALPSIPPPDASGPLGRAAIDRFLRDDGNADHAPILLTAADEAVLGHGRSIVIVDPDTTAAARWIAAMSFLLSPAASRRLSFATYHHRPGYIDVHMIGTVPDSDFEANEMAFRSYVVLDATTGRISDITPHPAALLLARAGADRAAALWSYASQLADGWGLADSYPALVVGALLESSNVTAADLDTLAGWLPAAAGRLDPAWCGDLVTRFLEHPDCQAHHWGPLTAAARRQPDSALIAQLEQRAVDQELQLVAETARDDAGTGVQVDTAEGREFAARRCAEHLDGASAGAAVALLGWSTNLGLQLPAQALRSCGELVLGPELMQAPGGDTLGVLAGDPLLLQGAVAYLSAVAGQQPGAVQAAFVAGLDNLVSQAAITLPPSLREPALLAEAGRFPERRPALLAGLTAPAADVSEPVPLRAGLLEAFWPAGCWTATEALAVTRAVGPGRMLAEPLLAWTIRAIVQPSRDEGYLKAYLDLCRLAQAEGWDDGLPLAAREQLRSVSEAVRLLERAGAAADEPRAAILGRLAAGYAGQPSPVQDILRDALAGQLDVLAGSSCLPALAGQYPEDVVSAYLQTAQRRLAAVPRDAEAAAALYRCLHTLQSGRDGVIAPALEPALRAGLGPWSRAEVDLVREHLGQTDRDAAAAFDSWREPPSSDVLSRRLHRFLGRSRRRQ
jgi:GTPase-associated protein 1, N-terminal domain type 2/GTPase-associated protein 1, C-terminal domain/GTPase-associated protein 1, middle domain